MTNTVNHRLNRFLATSLGISRREADEYIVANRIHVNTLPAHLGQRIKPDDDIITCDGVVLSARTLSYVTLHKPLGYVCSRRRQGDTPTIYELLPASYRHLKPVGRLDKDSSGIILLTNDGDFAHRMTHPSFHKTKIYEVALDKSLEPLHQQMVSDHGIILEDGKSKFELERLDDTRKNWRIIMHEGRNRQIRRTFAALGYTVTALHRTQFGNYALGDIKSGKYIELHISPDA